MNEALFRMTMLATKETLKEFFFPKAKSENVPYLSGGGYKELII